MFIPTTANELNQLNWKTLDIILVSGDTYIDTYYDGIVLIGKLLIKQGYKVGIIAQPDINSEKDILRLGEPELFWGISAGCVDSMVANYTALLKKRRTDDLTPGEQNIRRPDRATLIYTNLIKRFSKTKKPIILGGIEASMRRVAHYDYWSDRIRRSVLLDSKADILVYGMGEKAISELAFKIKNQIDWKDTKGICYLSNEKPDDFIELPSYEEVAKNQDSFINMFNLFYKSNKMQDENGMYQQHSSRFLVHNPPQSPPSQTELDSYYELDFERDAHPYYKEHGKIKALDTIRFSVTSHRGCFGECNFCSIAIHQGNKILSRSKESIIREVKNISKLRAFNGNISDIGGPSANMYGMGCKSKHDNFKCSKNCISPNICKNLNNNHNELIELLKELRKIPGIKNIFVGSGIRFELVLADKQNGEKYLKDIIDHHVSGQMKIAPEHISKRVLKAMGKETGYSVLDFKNKFYQINRNIGKKQFLTYYFIAAHPDCYEKDMNELNSFIKNDLKINPEQVQIFTPTPSTYSTLMYYTEKSPITREKIFVEKSLKKKREQKERIV